MRKILIVSLLVIAADVCFGVPIRSMLAAERNYTEEQSEVLFDAEVEYLESTGTQYIDTGFTFSDGYSFSFKFRPINSPFIAYGANSNGHECFIRSDGVYYWGGQRGSFGESISDVDSEINGSFDSGTAVLERNGVSAIFSGRTPNDKEVYLFAILNITIPPIDKIKQRIYYHSITSIANGLVQDLIPVRFTNSHGMSEGAMYDRVTGQLFRNLGTGSFIIGPDKE